MKKLYFPIAALLLFTAISGCKLDTPVYPTKIIPIPGYTGSTNDGANYYLKGTLDGKQINWQTSADGSSGWVIGSIGAPSTDPQGNLIGALSGFIADFKNLSPLFSVEIGTFHSPTGTDVATNFKAFVKPGTWAYGTLHNDINAKYITISYIDADGKSYSTANGAQTSSVELVSTAPVFEAIGTAEGLKVKLTFSCTLYPDDPQGSPIVLSNAETLVWIEDLL